MGGPHVSALWSTHDPRSFLKSGNGLRSLLPLDRGLDPSSGPNGPLGARRAQHYLTHNDKERHSGELENDGHWHRASSQARTYPVRLQLGMDQPGAERDRSPAPSGRSVPSVVPGWRTVLNSPSAARALANEPV
jgi:hypothetical protein